VRELRFVRYTDPQRQPRHPSGQRRRSAPISTYIDSLPARYPSPAVLLVEPHGDTRELYHLWLTQRGFAVTVAISGDDTVAVARAVAPDVVVVEPRLERGGVALIGALRTEPSCDDAVIVVLTTQADRSARDHAVEAGADAYLVKPCGMSQLAEAISSASRHRLDLLARIPSGLKPSRTRVRQAVQRCRAIRERLVGSAAAHTAVGPRLL
jgi:DNA-binding response OmpR family regulator